MSNSLIRLVWTPASIASVRTPGIWVIPLLQLSFLSEHSRWTQDQWLGFLWVMSVNHDWCHIHTSLSSYFHKHQHALFLHTHTYTHEHYHKHTQAQKYTHTHTYARARAHLTCEHSPLASTGETASVSSTEELDKNLPPLVYVIWNFPSLISSRETQTEVRSSQDNV